MDTATQINYLLGKLDATATKLADAAHPDLYLRLDLDCALPGAEGLTAYTLTHPSDAAADDLTLVPIQAHCAGPACVVPQGTV